MADSLSYGTLTASIIELPHPVAKAWLKHLGEDELLQEREYAVIDHTAMLKGELHELAIYRSSTSYHLIINPEEE